ncbi:ABC transporter permease [Luteolibacter sp. GHJ8]|uniref:ABC transporter permease n=1 Tax=Luteolibacter rhizosphaerae TaxID=2989719 RepID=A0ABT3G924_9BACT|nr:ABC transporter permease [Luteolibacter rhizosphaerae]MCW1916127.1 ABC transporter permease [Luteolibacter rhizosphaerae]
MKPSRAPFITLIVVLVFFYLPILFLVINSFNNSRFASKWTGFSTRWYERLFERTDILAALGNSVKVATAASLFSMIPGTAAAFALHLYKSKLQDAHRLLVTVPLVLPDILMGMSLLLLFVSFGMSLSLVTITVAHITFCLSYVALVVQARLQDFDFNVVEAAQDLGATKVQAFMKVTLPLLAPGILAGGLLAFTLSIDDYVITYFVKGPGSDTLPTLVYSMIKKSKDLPVINALSSLMLIVTFAIVFVSQRLTRPAVS